MTAKTTICGGAWSKIADELKRLPGKVSVCYEASIGYAYLHELFSEGAYCYNWQDSNTWSGSGTSKWEIPDS